MKTITVLAAAFFLPCSVFADCTEYKIIDHGDSVEAVCLGTPPTAVEQAKREQERDIAQNEQNTISRQKQREDECKALLPDAKTASEYGQMTLGEVWADKQARKAALERAEAMGCISPRRSSGNIKCITTGAITKCKAE